MGRSETLDATAIGQSFTPELWVEVRDRLRSLPRALRSYAYWKLRLDPVYALVLAELPPHGEVVDLGTGIGLLPMLLALTRPSLRIRAVEWDSQKARTARSLLSDFRLVTVEEADAHLAPFGSPSAIVMSDILHYSPHSEAMRWLCACTDALQPGGVLLIRELEPSRWAIAPVLERMAVHGRWNRGGGVYPVSSSELADWLTKLGLSVVNRPAGSGLFRANTLTIARRPGSPHEH